MTGLRPDVTQVYDPGEALPGCYLAHHAIHTPLQGRPKTMARFEAKRPGAQHSHVKNAACTYDLDASVGMLLAKLEELRLEENTLPAVPHLWGRPIPLPAVSVRW